MTTHGPDQRRFPRFPMQVEVELYQPGKPVQLAMTQDISSGGALIVTGDLEKPPLGTHVKLRVTGTLGAGETPPLVEATIIRHIEHGVALVFDVDSEDFE